MENQRKDARICQELYEQSNYQSSSRKHAVITHEHRKRGSTESSTKCDPFLVAMATKCKGIEESTRIFGYGDDWVIYTR
jgi:hypothetical protein